MDEALFTLGELGVLHLHPNTPLESATLSQLKEKIRLLEQVISIIPERFMNKLPVSSCNEEGFVYAKKVLSIREEAKHLNEEIGELESEYQRVKPWGNLILKR